MCIQKGNRIKKFQNASLIKLEFDVTWSKGRRNYRGSSRISLKQGLYWRGDYVFCNHVGLCFRWKPWTRRVKVQSHNRNSSESTPKFARTRWIRNKCTKNIVCLLIDFGVNSCLITFGWFTTCIACLQYIFRLISLLQRWPYFRQPNCFVDHVECDLM